MNGPPLNGPPLKRPLGRGAAHRLDSAQVLQQRILGLDPGSLRTGWGLIEAQGNHCRHIANGVIRLAPRDPLPIRLLALGNALEELVTQQQPTETVVEDLFVSRNLRTALVLGQARGVIFYVLAQRGLPPSAYAPAQIKQAITGAGRADKQQIGNGVRMLLALEDILPEDASDALAVAMTHAVARRSPWMRSKRR